MIYTYNYLGKNGRLGNMLWQIAWIVGQSIRHNGTPSIKSDWEYRPYFSVPEGYYFSPDKTSETVDGETLYYQELYHWNESEDIIHKIFQPSARAFFSLDGYHPESSHKGTCSIHYRRGDYLKNPNHFPIPTEKYYTNAIKQVLNKNPNACFYIFSDDINYIKTLWNKNNGLYKEVLRNNKVTFVEGVVTPVEVNERIEPPLDWLDLFVMRNCEYHIIANSSFSWWGAWLSEDKNVFYPSVWWGPALNTLPWREGIPGSWIEVEC